MTSTTNGSTSLIFAAITIEIDFFYAFSNEIYNAKQLEKEVLFIADTEDLPKKIINNLRWMIPMALDDRLAQVPQFEKDQVCVFK